MLRNKKAKNAKQGEKLTIQELLGLEDL
jgi:hypothetical protein